MASDILTILSNCLTAAGKVWYLVVEPYWTWWATGFIILAVYRFLLMPLFRGGASDVAGKIAGKRGASGRDR